MVSKFTLEGKKYVFMPKEEYDKLLLLATKNELKSQLLSFYQARKKVKSLFLDCAGQKGMQ
ncbi:hypothetical protein EGI26_01470 [Lacihabitans sp. CCS-44]|uniref:hypothetical protein n=1 Tax=Lacihabitans sp. CCS-44 TaxID=2487331 RepID=UPI0020CF5295|nr:hypothetical protein [Lacihabitans sp. CCS-44]MCP9753830.1 hypothetical protein [Lacihabitans sp. CCS-44]